MGQPKVRGMLRQWFGLTVGPRDPLPTHAADGRPLYYHDGGSTPHIYCPSCANHQIVSITDTYEASIWPENSSNRYHLVRFGLSCRECGVQMVPVRENCDACGHLGEDTIAGRVDGIEGLYCAACRTPAPAGQE